MRAIMLAGYVIIIYYAIRAVLRRLLQMPPESTRPGASKSTGGEMVLDHECRVYVMKNCAVTRRIRGEVLYFCSDDCAAAHAARSRD